MKAYLQFGSGDGPFQTVAADDYVLRSLTESPPVPASVLYDGKWRYVSYEPNGSGLTSVVYIDGQHVGVVLSDPVAPAAPTPDEAAIADLFRKLVLACLDDSARSLWPITTKGVHDPGASNADLPMLFQAIDSQFEKLVARYGSPTLPAVPDGSERPRSSFEVFKTPRLLSQLGATVKAYNDALSRLGVAPNGDDYNALLSCVETAVRTGFVSIVRPEAKGR